MYAQFLNGRTIGGVIASAYLFATLLSGDAFAAEPINSAIAFSVDSQTQRLEMIVNTSRILKLDHEVPRVMVNNTEVVRVSPLSPNQIQISALKPGVTQINLFNEDDDVRSVDVVVFADARQLEMVLRTHFPKAAIRIRPLNTSVMLSGYVDRPEHINRIINIASDYYPKVINNINVGGVQQISLHVKLMEVSRTKMRAIGMDWANFNGNDSVVTSAAGLISAAGTTSAGIAGTGLDTVRFGVVDGASTFLGAIRFLQDKNLAKVLAEPTLVTVSGRPASFLSGGEFPIIVPQSLGVNGVEFKQFGTRVDFVPIVLGSGNIRLEVRPQVSEIDNSRSVEINGILIPALRTRWVDTAVEMRAGQTLALAGLIQNRVESVKVGFPYLSDIPFIGNVFGRTEEENSEVELLVIVRPQLVDALDPHEAHILGPGERTSNPTDGEFYGRGYLEVPNCYPYPNCGFVEDPAGGGGILGGPNGMMGPPVYESSIPLGATTPNVGPIPAHYAPAAPVAVGHMTQRPTAHAVAPVVSLSGQRIPSNQNSVTERVSTRVQSQPSYPLTPPSVRSASGANTTPSSRYDVPQANWRTDKPSSKMGTRSSEYNPQLIEDFGYDAVD